MRTTLYSSCLRTGYAMTWRFGPNHLVACGSVISSRRSGSVSITARGRMIRYAASPVGSAFSVLSLSNRSRIDDLIPSPAMTTSACTTVPSDSVTLGGESKRTSTTGEFSCRCTVSWARACSISALCRSARWITTCCP